MRIWCYRLGLIGVVLSLPLFTGCASGSGTAEFPKTTTWTQRSVSDSAALMPVVAAVADFDVDGNLDIVVGYQGVAGTGLAAVYIFFQTDVDTFTAVLVGEGATFDGISALDTGDLDGDTHLDIVAACNERLLYLHSPADSRVSAGWTTTTFDGSSGAGFGQWNDIAIGDIDGINGDDIVACNENTGRVSWFVSPAARTSGVGWTIVDIDATDRTNASSVALDDIDGDGKLDVYSTAPGETAARVVWYSNPTDPAVDAWTKTTVGNFPAASRLALGDLNVDGRTDLVVLNGPGRQIGWYVKPVSPTTANWTGYLITQYTTASPVDIQVADLDGNSQPDIVVSTQNPGGLRWFTPIGSQTLQWGENNVKDLDENVGRIALGDIDADGRSDIAAPLVGTTSSLDKAVWLENPEP